MRQERGISLVEILIATFLLMVLVGPLFNLFSHSVAGTIMNRDEMLANDYAADLVAMARTIDYDDLPIVNRMLLNDLVVDNYSEKPLEEGFDRYLSVAEFTDIPNSIYRYKVITAEVEWTSSGVRRSIKMPAMIQKVASNE